MGVKKDDFQELPATVEERAKDEIVRLTALLKDSGISAKRVQALKPVIKNTAWMKVKLDDARELIKDSSVIVKYNNGGGQNGTQINPALKAYESLWKSYMSGMNTILSAFPKERVAEEAAPTGEEAPATVLELVRRRHVG